MPDYRFWLSRLLVLMGCTLLAAQATAANTEAAEQLAAELRGYESYQADFIQIVVDARGQNIQESRGLLKAKRPGMFFWETHQPMAQVIVASGDTVEVYDPDLEQVTVHPLDQQLSSTPALLLSGKVDNLAETYEVSVRKLGEDSTEYTLIPRSPDSLFLSLRMTFYDGELQEMRLEDSLEQRSILSFSNIRLNEEVNDTAFKLDYPDGVDVIQGQS